MKASQLFSIMSLCVGEGYIQLKCNACPTRHIVSPSPTRHVVSLNEVEETKV